MFAIGAIIESALTPIISSLGVGRTICKMPARKAD